MPIDTLSLSRQHFSVSNEIKSEKSMSFCFPFLEAFVVYEITTNSDHTMNMQGGQMHQIVGPASESMT